jgi:uncharacterized protein (TIGR03067 family)
MRLRVLLIVAAGLSIAAGGKDDDIKKAKEKLQGTWVVTGAEQAGEKTDQMNGQQLTVKGDDFTATDKGNVVFKATFKVDPTKKPAAIDVTVAEGEEKGKTALGIYSLEKDELKFCFAEPGTKDRPTEFATKKDSKLMLITLKREKK